MSLATDLANATNRARIATETLAVMDRATAQTQVAPLGVGDTAPDVVLPDATGQTVRLADLLASGPSALSFYRGGWCPYCNLDLRALQAVLPEIEAAGARLVAVSPQTSDASLTTTEKNGLTFTVLPDAEARIADAFGLRWTLPSDLRAAYDQFDLEAANGDDTFVLSVPATYVIGTGGTIRFAAADPDYTKRAEPSNLTAALHNLQLA